MKKCLKVLGILGIILAGIVVLYILVCGSSISVISKAPETVPAQFVTDFTLLEEKSYEVSEGDISMRIPTYYVTTNLRDYYIIGGEATAKNRSILIYYKSLRYVAGKLNMDTEFQEYTEAFNYLDENKPDYPLNLIFDIPEDNFEAIKKVATVNKHNYKFWNPASVLETAYYLGARQSLTDSGITVHAVYERDDVRAIVMTNPKLKDYYIVMLLKENTADSTYLFAVKTPDLDEVIKMLNTFEYNTGL